MRSLINLIVLTSVGVQCTVVTIRNGRLLGAFNGKYYSYLNVPYAEPPVGQNRFEDPIPLTKRWAGIRNATVPPVSCVQISLLTVPANSVEDCLILNVFTPRIDCKRRYPVHVYLHGGVFMFGSASSTDESYTAVKENVLVIPNYRIGPYGFLSSGDGLISGNFGLKDQQLVLKWVNDNIHAFCGDNRKVVLSGFSAGGASVNFQMLNPNSARYFSAAMSKSGVAISPWGLQRDPKKTFETFVDALQCQSKKPKAVKDCLKSRTKEEIYSATASFWKFRGNPWNPFGVVIEPNSVKSAFLTVEPRELIKRGKVPKIPWILSYTERDGSYTAAEFRRLDENGRELIEVLNTGWREIAPLALCYFNDCVGCSEEKATSVRDAYSDELRLRYMQDQDFSPATYLQLEQMFTDIMFGNGVLEMVDLYRKYVGSPVYYYFYRKPLRNTIGNVFADRTDIEFGEF